MTSYKVIPRCHQYLTPRYRQLGAEMAASKRVAHLDHRERLRHSWDDVRNELAHG